MIQYTTEEPQPPTRVTRTLTVTRGIVQAYAEACSPAELAAFVLVLTPGQRAEYEEAGGPANTIAHSNAAFRAESLTGVIAEATKLLWGQPDWGLVERARHTAGEAMRATASLQEAQDMAKDANRNAVIAHELAENRLEENNDLCQRYAELSQAQRELAARMERAERHAKASDTAAALAEALVSEHGAELASLRKLAAAVATWRPQFGGGDRDLCIDHDRHCAEFPAAARGCVSEHLDGAGLRHFCAKGSGHDGWCQSNEGLNSYQWDAGSASPPVAPTNGDLPDVLEHPANKMAREAMRNEAAVAVAPDAGERGDITLLTIEQAQREQPWVVPYSEALLRCEKDMPHLMGAHAVMHAAKTVGKLAAAFEALDHRNGPVTDEDIDVIRSMAPDLFTIAMRLANLFGFSLVTALRRRVLEKNGVDITARIRHLESRETAEEPESVWARAQLASCGGAVRWFQLGISGGVQSLRMATMTPYTPKPRSDGKETTDAE